MRQLVEETHLLRHLVTRDPVAAVLQDRAVVEVRPILEDHVGAACLAPFGIRDPDHCVLEHAVELVDGVLDLHGVDVLAARDEHVLPAIHDVVVAVLVHPSRVAGVEPPVLGERIPVHVRAVPVTGGDVRPADHQLPGLVRAQGASSLVDDLELGVHHREAGRAGLRERVLHVEDETERAGLGHAPELLQGGALPRVALQEREGSRRAPDPEENQVVEVRIIEPRLLGRHEEVRRHAEGMGDRGVAVREDAEEMPRVEGPHHDVCSAGMEDGVRVDVEPPGVERRKEDEVARTGTHLAGDHRVHRVVEPHPVGVAGALGPAGRPGGVHDGPGVAGLEPRVGQGPGGSGDPGLVVARPPVGEGRNVLDGTGPGHRRGGRLELGAVQERPWLRVAADELELRGREPPVERQEDRADPLAGELDLEDVGVVVGEHHDPITASHPEPVPQPEGGPADPFVEFRIGEAPARCDVVDRFAPGGVARVVGDPVRGKFGVSGRGGGLAHGRTTPSGWRFD